MRDYDVAGGACDRTGIAVIASEVATQRPLETSRRERESVRGAVGRIDGRRTKPNRTPRTPDAKRDRWIGSTITTGPVAAVVDDSSSSSAGSVGASTGVGWSSDTTKASVGAGKQYSSRARACAQGAPAMVKLSMTAASLPFMVRIIDTNRDSAQWGVLRIQHPPHTPRRPGCRVSFFRSTRYTPTGFWPFPMWSEYTSYNSRSSRQPMRPNRNLRRSRKKIVAMRNWTGIMRGMINFYVFLNW